MFHARAAVKNKNLIEFHKNLFTRKTQSDKAIRCVTAYAQGLKTVGRCAAAELSCTVSAFKNLLAKVDFDHYLLFKDQLIVICFKHICTFVIIPLNFTSVIIDLLLD